MEMTPNPETNPIIELAKFIAGTMTEGCECETCVERKMMVTRLVMNRHALDEQTLNKAVEGSLD